MNKKETKKFWVVDIRDEEGQSVTICDTKERAIAELKLRASIHFNNCEDKDFEDDTFEDYFGVYENSANYDYQNFEGYVYSRNFNEEFYISY